jgi:thiol-disulfide isomerase/thioredoxin
MVIIGDLWVVRAALEPNGRPKLVNHWATWCGGCVDELPDLLRAHREFGHRVDFVSIAWEAFSLHEDVGAARAAIEGACNEFGITWPNYVFDGTPEELFEGLELPDDKIPQTVVLDGDGRLKFTCVGPVRYDELAKALVS